MYPFRHPILSVWMFSLSLFAFTSCSSKSSGENETGENEETCITQNSERYLPLIENATWSYSVTEAAKPDYTKTNTVLSFEEIGDRKGAIKAYRVETTAPNGKTISWQTLDCTSVNRHREKSYDASEVLLSDQYFDPSKLRVDQSQTKLIAGTTWVETYNETEIDPITQVNKTITKTENWKMEAIDESLTVPAGTFTTIKLSKTTSGDAQKTYWFAKGVGKIKEVGEKTEELISYSVP